MEKTLLNIKTDKKIKREAQRAAKELGLPLGTIINAYLREFVREKRVVFSVPPTPNARTQKLLRQIERDIKANRNMTRPMTAEESIKYLDSL